MSSDRDSEELEEIRSRRFQALQRKIADQERKEQVEAAKTVVLRKILDPAARQRMTNLRMVRPDFAQQLELQLIQLAQTGKVNIPISDEQLKQILWQLQSQRRDTQIRRL